MIIALKVIVNNMLCFGNILHLYFCLHLNIYICLFRHFVYGMRTSVFFFIFKYKQQKFRTISFDLKANRNRGTPA